MSSKPKFQGRVGRLISGMSIRRKIGTVTLVVSLAALLLASGVVVTMGWISSRDSLKRDLTAQAEMLADNSAAAIAFEDEKDAKKLLGAFKAMAHVRIAAMYKADGTLLAGYSPDGETLVPHRPPLRRGYRFEWDAFEIAKPVSLDGDIIGMVFLRSDLSIVFSFVRILLGTLGGALLVAILVILTLTSWFQRFVSTPVIRLAAVAKRVSDEKDFSIRAIRETNDEIGLLTDTFNQTLDTVIQANRALVTSERNYREIFNGMSDAIIIHDIETGDIVDVNNSCSWMFGYDREELMALVVGQLSSGKPPFTHEEALLRIERTFTEGPQTFEWQSRRKSGELFWVEVALRLAEIGEKSRIIAVVRDINARKAMEAQLRQAQKMEAIGTLAGGIAHDFNNILQSILGNTDLARRTMGQDNPADEYLGNINTASRRAADIVSQILALSRQGDMEVQTVKMSQIVEESLRLLRASIPTTINFDVSVASDRYIQANASRLHQIIMNLCTNAYHAMRPKGGTLSISLQDVDLTSPRPKADGQSNMLPGHYVKLTVADTGEGMPDDLMKRIFDPYFTTKKLGEGTGLGLSVVDGILKSMNGAIEVESEVGEGSVFTIYFPAPMESHRLRPVLSSAPPIGTERVLVIDDEPAVAVMCGSMLTELGYRPEVVTSPEAGLESFRREPETFDAVVTDMTMPGMTGLDLAGELRKIQSDLVIILTTGFSEELSEERLNGSAVDTVLMKPYDIHDLAETLRSLLDDRMNTSGIPTC